MATKVRKKKPKLFYNVFIGEFVELTLKQSIQVVEQQGEIIITQNTPIMVSGIVIDIDDQFVYLGNANNEIEQAISRIDVSITTIAASEEQKAVEGITERQENKDLN